MGKGTLFWFLLLTATGYSHAKFSITQSGSNSTEQAFGLGTSPLTPLAGGGQTVDDPWSTPLVNGCPKPCSIVGPDPSNWTHAYGESIFSGCKLPLLFDLNIYNEESRNPTIRTCSANAKGPVTRRSDSSMPATGRHNQSMGDKGVDPSDLEAVAMSIASSDSCGGQKSTIKAVFTTGPAMLEPGDEVVSAVGLLSSYLADSASCGATVLFAKSGPAVVGLYAGADIQMSSASLAIDKFSPWIRKAQTLGLFAVDDTNDLAMVQKEIRLWAKGGCLELPNIQASSSMADLEVLTNPHDNNNSTDSNMNTRMSPRSWSGIQSLEKRSDCTAIQVVSGDSCTSLSARCGIRGSDFLKFNPKPDLCSTITIKQWVCCSAGTLPDMKPKPQPDGTCATYTVAPNDSCFAISDNHGITLDNIATFNLYTWGWNGCDRLQAGQVICLSDGNTPMPAEIPGAVCGPQKPGTPKPSGKFTGLDLLQLNECPLNACCSGWGFCGVVAEFCTQSKSGAPGSFEPGTNGCLSNCGTDIINNSQKPGSFAHIGYFQAYNNGRRCLNMDASEIDGSDKDLTHVHFAFGGVTSDFKVNIGENVREQFDKFKQLKPRWKKILSIGGWAESTEPATFALYREAVKPQNRKIFAQNVYQFISEHSLDGVDFDWEYPGAADQGIPASGPADTENYLRFLTELRSIIGTSGKSLSIAIPASYWYLKPFPVKSMANVVDYFIYMTYDLHGQWDYGNKFANPGCPNGNCLRSHVNRTETHTALSMITKAGVPASKVFVGVTSYGRSFRMLDPGCTGPLCMFTGSFGHSEAEPGFCTGTSGYIANAELESILNDTTAVGTLGKGMTDWVAFMDHDTKARRSKEISDLNFGGTTDWAIDLSGNFHGSQKPGGWTVESDDLNCFVIEWPSSLDDLDKNIGKIPMACRGMATMGVLAKDFQVALYEYLEVSSSSDYSDRFYWYMDWVKDSINARLDQFMALKTGTGLKYMDCKWSTTEVKGEGPCTDVDLYTNPNTKNGLGPRIVDFIMRDEEGFYKALLNETGIMKDWIQWKPFDTIPDYCPSCPPKADTCHLPDCSGYYRRNNFPRRIDDKDKIKIEDPKETIDKAYPHLNDLSNLAISSLMEMKMGILDADEADVATSFGMPLFMLQDASESIKEIKKIGKEQKDKKTREIVLLVLSIVFSVIPLAGFAGSVLGAGTRFAAAALVVGEIGNAVVSIVEVIDNPASAPFAVIGVLLGAEGIRAKGPRQGFKDAADVRRALPTSALKAFSKEFIRKDALLLKIVKTCFRQLELSKLAQETRLQGKLDDIYKQREELDKWEKYAVATMEEEYEQNRCVTGSLLEESIRFVFRVRKESDNGHERPCETEPKATDNPPLIVGAGADFSK
ncbi:hypothetical protein MferCBS31731_005839 [Microsporum ferrugineum]